MLLMQLPLCNNNDDDYSVPFVEARMILLFLKFNVGMLEFR